MGTADGQPSFERDIKPLFRESDRRAMDFAFDLWDYQEVKDNVDVILGRLTAGEMPCDGGWPAEKIALFRRWSGSGMAQ